MRTNRKPCRLGHFDCIGTSARDDRCFSDPSRCVRDDHGNRYRRMRHIYEGHDGECIRCAAYPEDYR